MNAQDIITRVREYTGDTRTEYLWSDNFLLIALTEAEKQACNRQDFIFSDSMTITLSDGVGSYSVGSSITRIDNIRFNGQKVIVKTRREMDADIDGWRDLSGMIDNDVYAVMDGRNIRFAPKPDATDAAIPVYIEGYKIPDAITAMSDEPVIPEEYHHELIWWVLYECYRKPESDTLDLDKALNYLSRFNEVFGPPVKAGVRINIINSPKILTLRPKGYTSTTTLTDDIDNYF